MNNYDHALNLFADISLNVTYAQQPFRQRRNIYATDKIALIQVSSTLPEEEYDALENPRADLVMSKPNNRNKVFTFDGLATLLNLIPKVFFEECDACDGTGKVEFEFEYNGDTYYHSADCPLCGGTGEQNLPVAKCNYRYGVKLESDTWPLKQKYLVKLIQTMQLLGVDTARLVYTDTQTYKFELDENVKVMFLCYHPKPEYEDFFICYTGEDCGKEETK